jgi:S1-C subfamily serine protease
MTLSETFETVNPSIVGFVSRIRSELRGIQPLAPYIFGTGFIVHSDGIVATNRHVIEAFEDLPKHPDTGNPVVNVMLSVRERRNESWAYGWVFVDLKESSTIEEFSRSGQWYGEEEPDLGFVQMSVREVPALQLASEEYYLRVGMPVATAGFPLGDSSLTALGKLNQVSPFLRHGIVSSVFPFPMPQPHGFTIDVLQQGGSSGSPIFRVDGPTVVGMMSSSVIDWVTAEPRDSEISLAQNTNISIAVPSAIIKGALDSLVAQRLFDTGPIVTLKEHLSRLPSKEPGNLGWEKL